MLPILTRYLTPEEYGLIALLQLSISLTTSAMGMNIHANISRNYFRVEKESFQEYLTAIYTILFFSFALFQFIYLCFFSAGWNPISIPDHWIAALPFIALMSMLNILSMTMIRNQEKPWLFFGFQISQTMMNLTLSIYLVVIALSGWEGRALAIVSTVVLFGLISFHWMYTKQAFSKNICRKKVKEVLKVSIPLIPHALAGTVITISDRFFINNMISTEAAGIYTVSFQFGTVILLFSDAFIKAWSPWFYRQMSNKSPLTQRLIVKSTYIAILGLIVLALAYGYIAKLALPYIIDERYFEAAEYVAWIAASYIVFGIYQLIFPYLVLTKHTSYLAFSSSTAMICNLILNYFFIDKFGVIGAVYATIVSYTVSAGLVLVAANKFSPMPWFLPMKKKNAQQN